MRDKECSLCGLCNSADTVCLWGSSTLGKGCKLMIINEMPSAEDDFSGKPFTGNRDRLVRDVLETAMNVPTDNIYFTNLVKCYAGKGEKPTENEAAACYTHLLKEIEEVQPIAILCLGELALNFLLQSKAITRRHGEIFTLPFSFGEVKVIPTFLAGYITYNETKLKDFAKDIERAYNIAEGYVTEQDKRVQIVECLTIESVRELGCYVREAGLMVFDYETGNRSKDNKHSAVDWFRPTTFITCISICFQPTVSYVIPLEHFEHHWTDEEREEISDILQALFEDYTIRKIGHNVKFDMHLASKYRTIQFRGRFDDTMLMHHLLDETSRHGLKEITSNLFKDYAGYEDAVHQYKWEEVPWSVLAPYCGTDTAMTCLLAIHFENKLLEDERVYSIYRNITIPVMKIFYEMEHKGALIDRPTLLSALFSVEEKIRDRDDKLRSYPEVVRYEEHCRQIAIDDAVDKLRVKRDAAKTEKAKNTYISKIVDVRTGTVGVYDGINFGSTKQIERLLFGPVGFQFIQTQKGTGKAVLEELEDTTGFVDDLLGMRTLAKMKSTYLEGILDRLDDNDRLHTTYNIHGTASGRISSSSPNLQNIPNVAKLKDQEIIDLVGTIKKLFIVEQGRTFFNWDLSQAELRMIAAFAQDDNMMGAYNNGIDLHKLTGAHLSKVTLEEFDGKDSAWQKEKRTRAKAANFGMIYGISPEGYREYAKTTYKIDISLKEATHDIDVFFSLYPKLLDYHELYKAKARKFGCVRTLYGRKRHTPNILDDNGALRSADERVAVNSPIQGSVGEWVLFTMVMCKFRLPESVYFVNEVHDSIMGSVPDDIRKEVSDMVIYTAENLPNMKYFGKDISGLKMKMDSEYSKTNWKAMSEYSGE